MCCCGCPPTCALERLVSAFVIVYKSSGRIFVCASPSDTPHSFIFVQFVYAIQFWCHITELPCRFQSSGFMWTQFIVIGYCYSKQISKLRTHTRHNMLLHGIYNFFVEANHNLWAKSHDNKLCITMFDWVNFVRFALSFCVYDLRSSYYAVSRICQVDSCPSLFNTKNRRAVLVWNAYLRHMFVRSDGSGLSLTQVALPTNSIKCVAKCIEHVHISNHLIEQHSHPLLFINTYSSGFCRKQWIIGPNHNKRYQHTRSHTHKHTAYTIH